MAAGILGAPLAGASGSYFRSVANTSPKRERGNMTKHLPPLTIAKQKAQLQSLPLRLFAEQSAEQTDLPGVQHFVMGAPVEQAMLGGHQPMRPQRWVVELFVG